MKKNKGALARVATAVRNLGALFFGGMEGEPNETTDRALRSCTRLRSREAFER